MLVSDLYRSILNKLSERSEYQIQYFLVCVKFSTYPRIRQETIKSLTNSSTSFHCLHYQPTTELILQLINFPNNQKLYNKLTTPPPIISFLHVMPETRSFSINVETVQCIVIETWCKARANTAEQLASFTEHVEIYFLSPLSNLAIYLCLGYLGKF